ncbi:MAG: FHA domain-containing protein [Planctomycetota bacterium]|nr:FHA domain-containing protein [Planctomycetota bacterium]
MPKLKVHLTSRLIKVFEIDKPIYTIGRGPNNDVQLLAKSVSRNHSHITKEEERYLIEDLGSSNGTKVNGVRINRAYLNDGDVVEIGAVKISYFEKEPPPVSPENIYTIKSASLPEEKVEAMLKGNDLGLVMPTSREVIEYCFEIARRFIEKTSLSQESVLNLQTALYEAIDNARRHGNKDDAAKMIKVFLRDSKESVLSTVIDEGEGFDFMAVLKKTAVQDTLTAARERYQAGGMGGLGIRLMLKCADRLEYDNKGSKITLFKWKKEPSVKAVAPADASEETAEIESVASKQVYAEQPISNAKEKPQDMEKLVDKYKDRISQFFEEQGKKKESAPPDTFAAEEDFLSFNLPDEFDLEDDSPKTEKGG